MYKMISYKGVTGVQSKYTPIAAAARLPRVEKSIGRGLQSVVSGINSLGSTLNSIAANTQNTVESWRDNIRGQIKSADRIQKQEAKTEKAEKKRKLFKDRQTEKRRKFQLRNTKEDKAEKKKTKKEALASSAIGAAKKAGGGIFAAIFGLFGLLGDAIKFKIFEWISKNPKAVTKLGLTLAAIGKFVFNIISFIGGMSLDGLVSFLENPISLKGFFGIIKFLTGAVPIFAGFVLLKNPKLMLEGAKKVIGGIVGGLRRLFGLQSKDQKFRDYKLKKARAGKGNFFGSKAGKIATGVGAAGAGFLAAKGAGASNAEAIGAGGGAAGGQMAGAKLGDMAGKALGIPGLGAVGGMVGGMAGGKIGEAVGGLIEPIVEPISKFFKMIGDTFGGIVAEIKAPLEEFFTTLGSFLTGVLEAVEPHMPIISKILGIGFKVLFWPLFLGMKALTAVLKLFTGGEKGKDPGDGTKVERSSSSTKENYVEKAGQRYDPDNPTEEQKQVIQFKQNMEASRNRAKGGWISGPQSGYTVSLDGYRPSFIGHGTEWVGSKMAAGGAFVVPFDTPATRSDRGLTSRRLAQAKRAGYATPFSQGGEYTSSSWSEKGTRVGGPGGTFVGDGPPPEEVQAVRKMILGEKGASTKNIPKVQRTYKYKSTVPKIEQKPQTEKKDAKPQGIWRWLAGAADHMTMGLTDFDKRGSMLDGAKRLKDNIGDKLEAAKQKLQEQRYEKLKNNLQDSASTIVIDDEAPQQMTGGDASTDNPIIVPGDHHHDADKYIHPKFGLINEFMTDPVEFM